MELREVPGFPGGQGRRSLSPPSDPGRPGRGRCSRGQPALSDARRSGADGCVALGIDVGGTKLLAVRIDADGKKTSASLQDSPRTGPALVADIEAAVDSMCDGTAGAIGVGVPGLVDSTGRIRFAPNLAGVVGTPLARELRQRFPSTAVWIGNDATAACWGEFSQGAAVARRDVVLVTLGTGIGGGVVVDGRLVEGHQGYGGEFGHMVVDPHGPRCPCGKQGCWERLASGSGLGLLAREAAVGGRAPRLVELAGGDPEVVRGEHVTEAAAQGDADALEIMERFAWWVALGLSNLANALDPEMFVIGGGLVTAAELFIGPTRQAFETLVEAPDVRGNVDIVTATLGAEAGAIGAALRAASGP